jgi:hypothetical protein
MGNQEFSPEFNKFKKLRDKAVASLQKCPFILTPEQLEKAGFSLISSEYHSEGDDDHEFHVYQKAKCKAVFLESYVEREGGMYFQTLYADPGCIQELESVAK